MVGGLGIGISGGRRSLAAIVSSLFSGYTGPGWWYSHQAADVAAGNLLYQDSAGAAAVYMPGQGSADPPVGFQVDRRYGGARGVERNPDPGFDNPSAYSLGGSGGHAAISGSAAVLTGLTGGENVVTSPALSNVTEGATYEVTLVISGYVSGTVGVRLRTGSIIGFQVTANGTYTRLITAGSGVVSAIYGTAAGANMSVESFSIREVLGMHRSQATGADRPTLSGRYNELLATATLSTQSVTVTAASRTLSFTGTGTVTLSGVSTAGPLVGTGASNRVSLTFTPTAGSLTLTVTGSVTLADLRLTDDATKPIPVYQAVVDASNYDTNGFPLFLRTNGTNTWMQTAATDWSSTDKVTVIGAFTKVSDAAGGVLLELSATVASNDGSFSVVAPNNAGVGNYGFYVRGTALGGYSGATYTAPNTAVISSVFDIGGASLATEIMPRINGATPTLSVAAAGPAGTGNFGNYALYWFRRAGTSSPASARDYGSIGIGKTVPLSQIVPVEKAIGRVAGVTV